nr:hypothetical protein [Tanacetum cinerariifolium]
METASSTDIPSEDKGKMIMAEPEITDISDLSLRHSNGTTLQANMEIKDAEYFDQLLQLHKAYHFSGFSCEKTDPWERILPTQTSLMFGKFLQLQEIPDGFPEHYFNFATYNEVAGQATIKQTILTDYIGPIQAIDRLITSRDATTRRTQRRTIDIQTLSGNTIG